MVAGVSHSVLNDNQWSAFLFLTLCFCSGHLGLNWAGVLLPQAAQEEE